MRKGKLFILLACIALSACAPKFYQVAERQGEWLKISDTIPSNTAMNQFIQPYKLKLDSIMDVVIGNALVPLTKAQPESTLGNFAADAQMEAGKAIDKDVCISVVNYGGLRIPFVPKGVITKGKVYEIMPFDNTITIVEVPGKVLIEFCNHMAARKGWPVSGLSYKIDKGAAIDILVDGKPVRMQTIYKVVTSDYIANGGDDCEFLLPLKKQTSTLFLRDALMQKIGRDSKNGEGINSKIEKRVEYAD